RVPAGRFRRAGSVCRPTWGPPTASRIGSCGCGRSKRDSVPPTRSPRTTRRWSARRSKPCSTRSRTVRLPWSSKAPRPPPAQTRLPRPFCDALEAGLRAEFHETEWKICYGLDSLVEGFIRRRDVPPADVPPVPFDATAFRAVSDEFVALAAPVRRGSLGADWIAKTAAALRRLRGCDDPVQVSREIRRQLVGAPKKEATRKHTFAGDNKAWEVWKTYRDRLRDDLRAPIDRWMATRLVRLFPVVLAQYEKVKARRRQLDQLDLLVKLRDLLEEDRTARGDFQRMFDHVFVDEFQDTDPLQAEIVLFLCERDPGARRWDD